MRKLVMWNLQSLDGCFEGAKLWDLDLHETAWGKDLEKFSMEQAEEVREPLAVHERADVRPLVGADEQDRDALRRRGGRRAIEGHHERRVAVLGEVLLRPVRLAVEDREAAAAQHRRVRLQGAPRGVVDLLALHGALPAHEEDGVLALPLVAAPLVLRRPDRAEEEERGAPLHRRRPLSPRRRSQTGTQPRSSS